jgi:tRNA(Ile)-lysidine synthetase-like protein
MGEVLSRGEADSQLIVFSCDRFLALPEPLRFSVLRLAAHRTAPRQVPLSRQAYEAILESLQSKRTGRPASSEWALGSGILLHRTGRALIVQRKSLDKAAAPEVADAPAFEVEIEAPGTAALPDGSRIVAHVTDDVEKVRALLSRKRSGAEGGSVEVLDADRAGPKLSVRTRRPGDTFHPLGAKGAKSLKSFLIDRKVPAEKRLTLPLVCSGDEIVWIVGVRIGESVRITEKTRRFLVLRRE